MAPVQLELVPVQFPPAEVDGEVLSFAQANSAKAMRINGSRRIPKELPGEGLMLIVW